MGLLDGAAACHPLAALYAESPIVRYADCYASDSSLAQTQDFDTKVRCGGTWDCESHGANWRQKYVVGVANSSELATGSRAHVLEGRNVDKTMMQSGWKGWDRETGRKVKKQHGEPVATVLELLKTATDVEAALAPWRGRLGRKEQSLILNEQKEWERAVAVYSWIKSLDDYQPNVFFYNIMFKILGRTGLWDLVDKSWEEMIADNVTPTNVTFSTLIDGCGRAGRREAALTWFEIMQKRGLRPDQVTINTLINLHKRAGDLKAAESLFNGSWISGRAASGGELVTMGSEKGKSGRDLVSYNTMIGMYGRAGDYIGASKMFADMMQAGVSPDSITFNTMIYICGCSGRREEAEALYKRMEDKGAVADETTYNILIAIAGKEGDGNGAMRYLEKMKAAGMEPDGVTFRTLLSVISASGMVKETEEILEHVRELRYSLGQAVIAKVVVMYVNAGLLDAADRAIQTFLSSESFTYLTFAVIINVYGEKGSWLDAAKMFQLYREDKASVPDVGVYNSMIKAYGLNKKFKDALTLFHSLEDDGVTADDITFNSIIQMCAAGGLVQDMQTIWEAMRIKGFKPSQPTYGAVLGLYGRLGQAKEALFAFQEMQKDGMTSDEICYGALLNAFCEAGSVKDAQKTFKAMKLAGFCEDSKAYTSLMKLYGKVGLVEEAKVLFLEAEGRGLGGDVYLVNVVIDILGKVGSLQEAERRYHELEDRGHVNKVTLTIMLNLYKDADLLQQAIAVAEKMQDAGFVNDLEGFYSVMGLYARAGKLEAAANTYLDIRRALLDVGNAADEIMDGILRKAGLVVEVVNGMNNETEEVPPEQEVLVRSINIHALAGRHDEALELCKILRQDGTKLNVAAYNAMIYAYGAASSFDSALRLFMEMQSSGLLPDVVTYTNIITVYGKMGLLEGVTRMFKRMKQKGCEPSAVTYSRIIEHYKEAGRLDLAAMVSHEMRFSEYLQQSRSRSLAQGAEAQETSLGD